jgi:predicted permease
MKLGGGVIGGRRQAQSLAAFLVAEVAFVTVLLVATTLLVTSFVLVTTADLGFDRHDVMTIDVSKSVQSVPKSDRQAAGVSFFADVLDRARAVPGVRSAGVIGGGTAPLGGGSTRYSLIIPGVGEVKGEDSFETRGVSPEYFSAMGLRLLRGRPFEASDRAGAPAVAIINDLAARRYFPGRDPIGQVVTFRGDTRIVGVVQNVRFHGPEADWHTELYVPLAQEPQPFDTLRAQLVVRTTGSASATASAVREAIRPAMAGATVPEPRFVDDAFRRLTAARRFNAGLMTMFGVVAVVIGAIGIYGTLTFVVAQQARAIGLRMALGASQSMVLRSILRESLWRVGVGVALGLIGARALASLFTSLVFGIQATSLTVYAGVAVGLAAMGVITALVPARRAAQLDPIAALRSE